MTKIWRLVMLPSSRSEDGMFGRSKHRTTTARPFAALILFLSPLIWSALCYGHPHSWISHTLTIHGEETRVDSLEMEWVFDPFTSAYALDGDFTVFDNEERASEEARRLMLNLLNTHYFTYLYLDGEPLKFRIPTSYSLTKRGKRMVLAFLLPLSKQVELSGQHLSIQTYDNTYFIDIAWKSVRSIKLDSSVASQCHVGLVQPSPSQEIQNYAMSLARDSEEDSELGQHFSQTVSIHCG
ncbi:DUF1007 family protein [Vibrio methylphosphonaticus]|uniref:DUF1007 family protein n=1 Tax=Vibrio methylphosphonaticus TaxID=2946866 RepID=UPI00202AA751|nr:DUF1007 family protein [Vibrio methylphosphonaticus]MCL9773588.1 DUF1007 family protein [Vibrio methylphosphonaticus]